MGCLGCRKKCMAACPPRKRSAEDAAGDASGAIEQPRARCGRDWGIAESLRDVVVRLSYDPTSWLFLVPRDMMRIMLFPLVPDDRRLAQRGRIDPRRTGGREVRLMHGPCHLYDYDGAQLLAWSRRRCLHPLDVATGYELRDQPLELFWSGEGVPGIIRPIEGNCWCGPSLRTTWPAATPSHELEYAEALDAGNELARAWLILERRVGFGFAVGGSGSSHIPLPILQHLADSWPGMFHGCRILMVIGADNTRYIYVELVKKFELRGSDAGLVPPQAADYASCGRWIPAAYSWDKPSLHHTAIYVVRPGDAAPLRCTVLGIGPSCLLVEQVRGIVVDCDGRVVLYNRSTLQFFDTDGMMQLIYTRDDWDIRNVLLLTDGTLVVQCAPDRIFLYGRVPSATLAPTLGSSSLAPRSSPDA